MQNKLAKKLSFLVVLFFITPAVFATNAFQWEMGARFGFGSGTIGAPQPLLNYSPTTSPALASRLTYEDLRAYSGEVFGRVDHRSGWFMKGYLGAGGITNGNLYDEDFPYGPVYSNTISSGTGYFSYATLDVGHRLLQSSQDRLGVFVGYNYYAQHVTAVGCAQIAGSTTCQTIPISPNYPIISEDDHFNSLRLGFASEFALTERLTLASEAAYLPVVTFNGQDDHNGRALILPESANLGDGVMLESILNYAITNHWDIGLGGRYWAWNTRNGTTTFNYLDSSPSAVEPAHFSSDRYSIFLQTKYSFDAKPPSVFTYSSYNWNGFFVGLFLGGGWGSDQWSDPFNNTQTGGFTNIAGFGDSIYATGPLGGAEINFNIQKNSWVFGLNADVSRTDFRGENTCFSGLGGINCQRIVNALGTFTGSVGTAWNQSLFYVKAGGALANTTYNLNGNTTALTLGTESTTVNSWGWTVGAGIEHALDEHWVTKIEYDLVEMPTTSIPFPNMTLINQQNIKVSQYMNIFKLGLKYKFA